MGRFIGRIITSGFIAAMISLGGYSFAPGITSSAMKLFEGQLCAPNESLELRTPVAGVDKATFRSSCRGTDGVLRDVPEFEDVKLLFIGTFATIFLLTLFSGTSARSKTATSIHTIKPSQATVTEAQLTLSPEEMQVLRDNLQKGNIIGAIKSLRTLKHLGLAESKNIIEALQKGSDGPIKVVTSSFGIDPGESVARRMATLEELKTKGLISESEYEAKRAEILREV